MSVPRLFSYAHDVLGAIYRKIPKIIPGLIFFKGLFRGAYFWRGLYSEGLIYGGKFAFPNRLG